MMYLILFVVGAVAGAGAVAVFAGKSIRSGKDLAQSSRELALRADARMAEAQAQHATIASRGAELEAKWNEVAARNVSVEDFVQQSRLLKQELAAAALALRKTRRDCEQQAEATALIDKRSQELAREHLKCVEGWVARSITANNYTTQKQRLQKAIDWCREIGFAVALDEESRLLAQLKSDFEDEVRKQVAREEQARIKAKIREEERREAEVKRELERLERDRAVAKAALDRVMAETAQTHSAQVEELRAKLAEAEARLQRTVSQSQLTRAGHVYIISNLGAFGDGVFKIGMTRRLDPHERVSELGDASVPFGFDVHAMISCDDAPGLENKLHKHFHRHRINKVNPRKEYFRVSLAEIVTFVEANHGTVEFLSSTAAEEFHQSAEMSDIDQHVIEQAFDAAERSIGVPALED